jgi:hypothetical protein
LQLSARFWGNIDEDRRVIPGKLRIEISEKYGHIEKNLPSRFNHPPNQCTMIKRTATFIHVSEPKFSTLMKMMSFLVTQ